MTTAQYKVNISGTNPKKENTLNILNFYTLYNWPFKQSKLNKPENNKYFNLKLHTTDRPVINQNQIPLKWKSERTYLRRIQRRNLTSPRKIGVWITKLNKLKLPIKQIENKNRRNVIKLV